MLPQIFSNEEGFWQKPDPLPKPHWTLIVASIIVWPIEAGISLVHDDLLDDEYDMKLGLMWGGIISAAVCAYALYTDRPLGALAATVAYVVFGITYWFTPFICLVASYVKRPF